MLKMNCTNVPFRLHIFQFQLHKKGTTVHYFKACHISQTIQDIAIVTMEGD